MVCNGLQVSCFGLGMVALDIRQESTRHTDALDAITTYLGLGSYKCSPSHAFGSGTFL